MFYHRKCLSEIRKYIHTPEVVVIHGARQTGKTTLMQMIREDLQHETTLYFDLEDSRYKMMFDQGVDAVIGFLKQKGNDINGRKIFLFIDEIQNLENPSSFLKLIHDHYPNLKLIVSGSSSFEIKSKFKDTLVGRTVNFELFPLDFEEFLWFKEKKFDLSNIPTNVVIIDELKVLYNEFILFGGYPKIVLTEEVEKKERYLQQIIDTYVKSDIRDLARIKHINKFNQLLYVIARQSGQLLNLSELSNTTRIARQTIEEYIFILEQTYIIKRVSPFYGNIRSELFKTPKVFFYDTGIMNMLAKRFLPPNADGSMFETAIFGDLVKNFNGRNLNFWRTGDKKEIDFILTLRGGIIPIEVKLNAGAFNYTPAKYFIEKYKTRNNYCISLEGELPSKAKNVKSIFPWDIYAEFM